VVASGRRQVTKGDTRGEVLDIAINAQMENQSLSTSRLP